MCEHGRVVDQLVLVNGLPGSGKTSLAHALAPALSATMIVKDAIKEAVADVVPAATWPVLGAATMEFAWTLTAALPGLVVLESWWFRPRDRDFADAGLQRCGRPAVVEVWCDVAPAVAQARYAARQRHPVHADPLRLVDAWPAWAEQAARSRSARSCGSPPTARSTSRTWPARSGPRCPTDPHRPTDLSLGARRWQDVRRGLRLRRRAAAPADVVHARTASGTCRRTTRGCATTSPRTTRRPGRRRSRRTRRAAGPSRCRATCPTRGCPPPTVLAGGDCAGGRPLDAAQLGRVLFLGAGVVRTADRRGTAVPVPRGRLGRRAASRSRSTPAPAASPASRTACTGTTRREHALVQVGPPAGGDATTLVVTGVPWRTGWRYAERGWRHLYWDAGTLLSQLSRGGRERRPRAAAADACSPTPQVRRLVGADGVHEYPVALLTFGDGAAGDRARRSGGRGRAAAGRAAAVHAAQRAGERDELGAPWPSGCRRLARRAAGSDSLDAVVAARGSQRRMDRSRTLPRPRAGVVDGRGAARDRRAALGRRARRGRRARPASTAGPTSTAPSAAGDLRDELAADLPRTSTLAAEAAFVVIAATPRPTLDDRALPRRPARGRPGRGAAAPGGVRARRERHRHDVPRLGGARAARRAGRPGHAAVHLRRRAGVPLPSGRRPPGRR